MSQNEEIAAKFVVADPAKAVSTLFLHGAGKATKERALPIATRLASEFGISSMLFDFSGHGESTGELTESSLRRRVNEATDAVRVGGLVQPLTICGFSMGGPIAISLLQNQVVRTLVLFYSAAYSRAVTDLKFGDPLFSSTIRQHESWRDSESFEILKGFRGNLLVVTGENDDVIPHEIPKLFIESATHAKSRELISIPDAPHLLIPSILQSEDSFSTIVSKIARLYSN